MEPSAAICVFGRQEFTHAQLRFLQAASSPVVGMEGERRPVLLRRILRRRWRYPRQDDRLGRGRGGRTSFNGIHSNDGKRYRFGRSASPFYELIFAYVTCANIGACLRNLHATCGQRLRLSLMCVLPTFVRRASRFQNIRRILQPCVAT